MSSKVMLISGVAMSLLLNCCRYDKVQSPDIVTNSNYPEDVANIVVNKCATSGCHNSESASAASGLNLISWEAMFAGNNNGAVTIPFRSDQSTMCYFTNTDTLLGIVIKPTMPLNTTPLSKNEYLIIKNWIDSGAPDKNGAVAFSGNPTRKKFYVVNQGCDLISVFDAEKKVIMRYINCGLTNNFSEAPHMMKLAPDGEFYYIIFYAGNAVQKFRAADDSLMATCLLDQGQYNAISFTADSKFAWISDLSGGRITKIDLTTMASPALNTYYNVYNKAHGLAFNPNTGWLYVTNQNSNFIYKCNPNDINSVLSPDQIKLEPGPFIDQNSLNPHEIVFSPDGSKYFVSCDLSNEIRVLDATADTLLAVIPSPVKPLEFAVSTKSNYPYLFVTCQEEPSPQPGNKGAVLVINYNTLSVAKILNTGFFQPHGIAINEDDGVVYVASRNADPNGPAPHHISNCGGRNGFMRMIRISDLSLLPWKNEVSVDPYSVFYRP